MPQTVAARTKILSNDADSLDGFQKHAQSEFSCFHRQLRECSMRQHMHVSSISETRRFMSVSRAFADSPLGDQHSRLQKIDETPSAVFGVVLHRPCSEN